MMAVLISPRLDALSIIQLRSPASYFLRHVFLRACVLFLREQIRRPVWMVPSLRAHPSALVQWFVFPALFPPYAEINMEETRSFPDGWHCPKCHPMLYVTYEMARRKRKRQCRRS